MREIAPERVGVALYELPALKGDNLEVVQVAVFSLRTDTLVTFAVGHERHFTCLLAAENELNSPGMGSPDAENVAAVTMAVTAVNFVRGAAKTAMKQVRVAQINHTRIIFYHINVEFSRLKQKILTKFFNLT